LNRCPDARGLLPEYVEGELSSIEARRLEGHLVLCTSCRLEETRYRAASGALKAPRPLATHGDLSSGLASKLAKYEKKSGTRQLQLRWAGACCLLLAVGGASASYMRTYFSALVAIDRQTSNSVVNTPPIKVAVAPATNKPANPEKVVPESTFEFKNEEPKNIAQRDPFDPKGLGVSPTPSNPPVSSTVKAGRSLPDHPQKRTTIASGEREGFLDVQPREGRSAEEIIVQKRREETVAQYSAPPPVSAEEDSQPIRIIRPDDKHASSIPTPDNTNEHDPGTTSPAQPVAVLTEKDSEVNVNGKKTNVRSAMGYDKSGRPVLVKVNIGTNRMKKIDK